jgi:ornithine cyclodeaminase/alanine dehydrogenase-like protein (mu-crystallin family)
MLFLSESDVRAVLTMADLIEAMERALAEYSAGRVAQPVRTVLEVGPERNYFGVMPAALNDPPAVGAKLVTVHHRNHERGLPSHLATIVLSDHETGALVAVLDGRYITEARTAAVSAVSVRHLANPGASVLAILGSGVQAGSHLEAIRLVAPLADVRVWSPNAAHREEFASRMTVSGQAPIRAVADARTAVRDADLIVLVTASRTPVVDIADVSPGAHISAVGACRPDQREMSTALVAGARVYVDSRPAALVEAGEVLLPMKEGAITADHIVGELGELINGRIPGRRHADEITIFKSLGMAVEDVVAAKLAVDRAQTRERARASEPRERSGE